MQPSLALRKKFYEELYKGFEGILANWFSPSETYAVWRSKSTIERFFGEHVKPGMTVLDMGCGIGSDIFSLNLYCEMNNISNVTFHGMDISSSAVGIANRVAKIRGYNNCKFFTGDLENMSLQKKYDIILCAQVMEHTIDMKGTMTKINGHLKDGGIFVISLPFVDRIKLYAPGFIKRDIWKNSEWGLRKGGKHVMKAVKIERKFESEEGSFLAHTSLLKLSQIKDNLKGAGFKIEKVERAFLVEGNRWFDNHPITFASLVILDRLIPFKRFGSDIIIKSKKI